MKTAPALPCSLSTLLFPPEGALFFRCFISHVFICVVLRAEEKSQVCTREASKTRGEHKAGKGFYFFTRFILFFFSFLPAPRESCLPGERGLLVVSFRVDTGTLGTATLFLLATGKTCEELFHPATPSEDPSLFNRRLFLF